MIQIPDTLLEPLVKTFEQATKRNIHQINN
jgi:hypothetical protein